MVIKYDWKLKFLREVCFIGKSSHYMNHGITVETHNLKILKKLLS